MAHGFDFGLLASALPLAVASRAANVSLCTRLVNLWRTHKLPRNLQHMLLAVGLRGAVAYGLSEWGWGGWRVEICMCSSVHARDSCFLYQMFPLVLSLGVAFWVLWHRTEEGFQRALPPRPLVSRPPPAPPPLPALAPLQTQSSTCLVPTSPERPASPPSRQPHC